MRRITDFASLHKVRTAPHGPPDISPIGQAAHAHLNIWAPNFGIQEIVGFGNEWMEKVFGHPLRFEEGHLFINDALGLGVTFNESEAMKYPYKRSYLPVSRLDDGTLWDW